MSSGRKIARLRMKLKGFLEPRTDSEFEGTLETGRYDVLEFRGNYPDAQTDYALVVAPALGAGDTWICTRWKHEQYADVTEAPTPQGPQIDFGGDDLAIPEKALVKLLPRFHDFTYDRDDARYPHELPNVRVPLAPARSNNCCTFVEALLVRAWADACPRGFLWSQERHRQMMIMSNDDFFSPVTAIVESGIARAAEDSDAPPGPWTIVQGWRQQWRGGHTFIVVDHDIASDRILTLESNSSYGLNGVGFRKIGNLKEQSAGKPPARWWENQALWTWQQVTSTYRFRQQAQLKVTDRSWSGR